MQSLRPRPRKIQPAFPRRRLESEQLHREVFRAKGESRTPSPSPLVEVLGVLDLGHTLVGGEGAGRDAQEAEADYAPLRERMRKCPLQAHNGAFQNVPPRPTVGNQNALTAHSHLPERSATNPGRATMRGLHHRLVASCWHLPERPSTPGSVMLDECTSIAPLACGTFRNVPPRPRWRSQSSEAAKVPASKSNQGFDFKGA